VKNEFQGEFESMLDLVRHMSREIENSKQQHGQIMSENNLASVAVLSFQS
jgi:hypothetical protein